MYPNYPGQQSGYPNQPGGYPNQPNQPFGVRSITFFKKKTLILVLNFSSKNSMARTLVILNQARLDLILIWELHHIHLPNHHIHLIPAHNQDINLLQIQVSLFTHQHNQVSLLHSQAIPDNNQAIQAHNQAILAFLHQTKATQVSHPDIQHNLTQVVIQLNLTQVVIQHNLVITDLHRLIQAIYLIILLQTLIFNLRNCTGVLILLEVTLMQELQTHLVFIRIYLHLAQWGNISLRYLILLKN